MSLFTSFGRGFIGGAARGVEDALTLEDQRIEDQTKEALKEFKSRVKDQKARRRLRQGKLEDVIGSITGRGYSLTTAASLVKQNGIAGANKIMADSDLAYERGGISRNQFIEAVENASSPGALSNELSTVSQAAETLAFQAFPAISREEFSAPKAPFSGSIISPEDDQDPEYREQMLARLSESGVLPEQAKPEFESLPSGNTFTINRDLVPTALDIKRREMPTKARLLDIMATGTPEEKEKADGALRQIVAAESNNRFEELKNRYFDKDTPKEEKAAIAKQIQQFKAAGEDPLETSRRIAAVVTAAVTQNNTAINSQFSRTRTASNDKALSPEQAALGVAQPKQKEQFKINGKVFEYVDVDSPEHKKLEARYLKERRAQVKSLLDKQGIPDQNNIREQVEAMLLPEEVVSTEQQISGSGRTEVDFKETTSEEPPEVTPKFAPENIRNLREVVENSPDAPSNATHDVELDGKLVKVSRDKIDNVLQRAGIVMRDGVTVDEKEDTRINTVANLLLKNVKLGILDDVSSRSKGGLGGRVLDPATTRSPRGQAKDRAVYIQERINLDDDIAKQQVSQEKLAEIETLMPIFLDRTGEYSSLSEEEKEAEFLKQVKSILGD